MHAPSYQLPYPYLALTHLKLATGYKSKHFTAFLKYAELLIAFSKYKEALDILNHVIKMNNNIAKAHLLKGYLFQEMDNMEQAVDCFYQAIQVDPEFI